MRDPSGYLMECPLPDTHHALALQRDFETRPWTFLGFTRDAWGDLTLTQRIHLLQTI